MTNLSSPQTYEVIINEYQRAMLARLVNLALTNNAQVLMREPGDVNPSMYDEAQIMEGMLLDLPRHEKDHPGVTHGLCL